MPLFCTRKTRLSLPLCSLSPRILTSTVCQEPSRTASHPPTPTAAPCYSAEHSSRSGGSRAGSDHNPQPLSVLPLPQGRPASSLWLNCLSPAWEVRLRRADRVRELPHRHWTPLLGRGPKSTLDRKCWAGGTGRGQVRGGAKLGAGRACSGHPAGGGGPTRESTWAGLGGVA